MHRRLATTNSTSREGERERKKSYGCWGKGLLNKNLCMICNKRIRLKWMKRERKVNLNQLILLRLLYRANHLTVHKSGAQCTFIFFFIFKHLTSQLHAHNQREKRISVLMATSTEKKKGSNMRNVQSVHSLYLHFEWWKRMKTNRYFDT